jgi:hypothetical protein
MSTLIMPIINTLRYSAQLEEAGIPRKQAELQAMALSDALDNSSACYVTQADLTNATTKLEKAIIESTIEIKSDIRIFKWCFGIMLPAIITLVLPVLHNMYQQFLGH